MRNKQRKSFKTTGPILVHLKCESHFKISIKITVAEIKLRAKNKIELNTY